MDFPSPNPISAVMGSETIQVEVVVPETETTLQEQALEVQPEFPPSPKLARAVVQPEAQVTTAPAPVEDVSPFPEPTEPVPSYPVQEPSQPPPVQEPPQPSPAVISQPPPVLAPPTTGLQIVTRKRSSLCATSAGSATLSTTATGPGPVKEEIAASKEKETPAPPPKKKKKYVPKPKNPAAGSGTTSKSKKGSGSSKSKSKKSSSSKSKKGSLKQSDEVATGAAATASELNLNPGIEQPQLLPPLKLQLPKTKIPQAMPILEPPMPLIAHVKMEPQYEDMEGDAFQSLQPDGGDGKPSRKKKSKGRNGNIYIGVFNRIEWMKLQDDFGFSSVNNFGTFVLQTMRKIHGDISFWCDLAKASSIYPDLDKYVWTNGFPHAINTDGQTFSPPEVQIPDDKRGEVVELAKSMWEQRLHQLQMQQQFGQNNGEGGTGPGGNGVVVIPDEGDEDEEEEWEDAGVENYLENMANGQYSPVPPPDDGVDPGETLTAEQVNMIWNEQMKNAQNIEQFGKLFSFVNSIGQQQVDQVCVEDMAVDGEGLV